jgi:3-isopropylmalate/(R)-2-methylmalate dehydratase large subunit
MGMTAVEKTLAAKSGQRSVKPGDVSSPTEMRAYGVFVPPSAAIIAEAKSKSKKPFTAIYPDADAHYGADLELDVTELEPQVALPGGVQHAVDLREVEGTNRPRVSGLVRLEHVGRSCKRCGNTERPACRVPCADVHRSGSEQSTRRMASDGMLQIFIEAGALMLPAGCGPCNDAVVGPVHSGEISISTAANNNFGRFGAKDAQLYLGSPATVAASAVAGSIADPRSILLLPPPSMAAIETPT